MVEARQAGEGEVSATVATKRASARRVLVELLACLSLPALVGTLAAFCGRWGWLWELSCHFRVQYFWALAICGLGLALLKRSRWSLVCAIGAGANAALIVPLYFGPAHVASDQPHLRGLSQNVHYYNRQYDRVLELVRTEDPDFALFMEVTPEWAQALTELEADYPYKYVFPHPGSQGIAFYSRWPMSHLHVEAVGGVYLPTVITELNSPSGVFTFMGSHPASPATPDELDLRNQGLAGLADVAAGRTGPLMLMGDLNTTGWSPYFQDLLARSGLRDSRRGFGVEGSWPWLPLPLRIPIDHCLVSREISIVSRRVGPSVGSDHRAVIVDFVLGATAAERKSSSEIKNSREGR